MRVVSRGMKHYARKHGRRARLNSITPHYLRSTVALELTTLWPLSASTWLSKARPIPWSVINDAYPHIALRRKEVTLQHNRRVKSQQALHV